MISKYSIRYIYYWLGTSTLEKIDSDNFYFRISIFKHGFSHCLRLHPMLHLINMSANLKVSQILGRERNVPGHTREGRELKKKKRETGSWYRKSSAIRSVGARRCSFSAISATALIRTSAPFRTLLLANVRNSLFPHPPTRKILLPSLFFFLLL